MKPSKTMKLIPALFAGVAFVAAGCASTEPAVPAGAPEAAVVGGHADYDALLCKYVKGEWVDYAGWKANAADVDLIVDPAKKEVQISKLFEWYEEDFVSDPKRTAAKPESYLLAWAGGEAKSVLASGGYAVKIIESNWTLNEKR